MIKETNFKIGDKVTDTSGYQGTIVNVSNWRGSIWYDVRFASGTAVRYPSDLILQLPKYFKLVK